MKIATLFSGGGGFDLGAIAARCSHLWGLEYNPQIAEVFRENIGDCHNLDILDADPRKFEKPDWLHASPVCKAFSSANAKAGEKQWDINCGKKVAEFVEVLQPQYFSLENVMAYRKAKAFHIIVDTLHSLGYWTNWSVLNAADFGVPQSRKRLILRAVKGGFLAPLPAPVRHVGWYEAIADLVHDLPDSQLAEWQIKALPDDIRTNLLLNVRASKGSMIGIASDQCQSPSHTIPAAVMKERPKALLIENTGARSDRPLQTREPNEPSWTIRAMGQDGHWHKATALIHPTDQRTMPVIKPENPSFTLTANQGGNKIKALNNGRVVQLDIACLARLQSFPDSYKFPGRKSLAGTIIGNSVPPLMAQRIIESTL